MGALRQRFFKEPDLALQREIEEGWRRLSSRVSKDDQKRILGLVDLQTALLDESTLASFAAGFQVASWLRTWYELYSKPNVRPSTAEYYRRSIEQHVAPRIGGIKLNRLTSRDIQKLSTPI